MIVYEAPERYRGTIEVWPVDRLSDPEDFSSDVVTQWFWHCKSNNHTIVGHGEGYNRKAGALNAIDAQYSAKLRVVDGTLTFIGTADFIEASTDLSVAVTPWRLLIRDRHGDITTTGAVY